jgi:hypothetical protein
MEAFMHYFERLGSLVGELWKRRDYDERVFPEVAKAALLDLPPNEHTSFADTVNFGLTANPLPAQSDPNASFGQPPLTVYAGGNFEIQALFWTGTTPSIHQHSFSGAFHVLHGSSLHLTWEFDVQERVLNHLLYGDLRLKNAELLHPGDHRPILAGSRFIHTTFHLERPTVSLVVRTMSEELERLQYAYDPPAIAFGPQQRASDQKRHQILDMLVAGGRRADYYSFLKTLLAECDTLAAFRYLRQAAALLESQRELNDVLESARTRHPKLIETIVPVLSYIRRQSGIIQLREKVSDPDLKLFLAFLANIPDRRVILDLIQYRYPLADPAAKFASFIKQLCVKDLLGDSFQDEWFFMLECLLRNMNGRDAFERAFKEKYGEGQTGNHRTSISVLAVSIPRFWLLQNLFEDVPAIQWMSMTA